MTTTGGGYQFSGALRLPYSQRRKIEAECTTEDQKKNASLHFWLVSDPYASWRRLILHLHILEEHEMARRIYSFAEKLTGMICTLSAMHIP